MIDRNQWRASILQSALAPNAKLLAHTLEYHINKKTGSAWPSQLCLSQETGLSIRSIRAATRALEQHGYITFKRGCSIRSLASSYQLTLPETADCVPAPAAATQPCTGTTCRSVPAKFAPVPANSAPVPAPRAAQHLNTEHLNTEPKRYCRALPDAPPQTPPPETPEPFTLDSGQPLEQTRLKRAPARAKKPVMIWDASIGQEITLDAAARSLIDWLNEKAGTAFTYAERNLKLVRAILRDQEHGKSHLTLARATISRQCSKWLHDEKMAQYLRPSTLFRPSNWESYVNAQLREARARWAERDAPEKPERFAGRNIVMGIDFGNRREQRHG